MTTYLIQPSASVGVLRRADRRDRVDREHVLRRGDLHRLDVLPAALASVAYTIARVGVAGGHRGQRRLHVGARGDLVGRDRDAALAERLAAYLPHGTAGAHNETMPDVGEVAERLHVLRVAGLHHDGELFAVKSIGSVVT